MNIAYWLALLTFFFGGMIMFSLFWEWRNDYIKNAEPKHITPGIWPWRNRKITEIFWEYGERFEFIIKQRFYRYAASIFLLVISMLLFAFSRQ